MKNNQFSYQEAKSGIVMISSNNRVVTILKGKAARKYLMKVRLLDESGQQRHMAKVTGQFKFGNERSNKE